MSIGMFGYGDSFAFVDSSKLTERGIDSILGVGCQT